MKRYITIPINILSILCTIAFTLVFLPNIIAQPTNDLCSGATALTIGTNGTCTATLGNNNGATDSMVAAPTCATFAGADAWYQVTVPASGNVTIEADVGDGTITDMGMSLYSGTCGSLVEIECDDDDGPGLFPLINQTGLNPGDVLFIRIWEFGGDVEGDFNICAFEPAPPAPGDECADPIPYPGDVLAGTCVTGFDFTIFSDSGMPSPTCDFGGDNVAWFSWTAPIITAAGDPIELTFDDGDGQVMDCDIGIEAYELDCTTPASNCLGNVSGMLTGLTQGTDYVLLIYDDGPADANCDFCLSIACSAPAITATAVCQAGDEANFYVDVNVTSIGVGNSAYTVDVGGPQANITAAGVTTYGPFPSGTPVDVVLTGVDDATCGVTVMGLNMECVCDPLSVEAVADGSICPGDPFTLDATFNDVIPGSFIDYTVTPAPAGSCTATPDNPADCVDLGLGDDSGSGPIPLGFNFDFFGVSYSSVCVGSNGYVTFTCVDETDLSEDAIPNPNDPNAIVALFWDDLNPTDAISGIICTYPSTIGGQTCFVADYQGVAQFGGGETVTGQIIICPDNTVTINCIDCQSDGGTDTAVQGIEDETGTTGAFDPAFPGGTVPGATTTSNCVTFTPNVSPPSACNFVAWVTDINDIAGTTVSTTNPVDVNPMTGTTYFVVADCDGVPCSDEVVVSMEDQAICDACSPVAPAILQSRSANKTSNEK